MTTLQPVVRTSFLGPRPCLFSHNMGDTSMRKFNISLSYSWAENLRKPSCTVSSRVNKVYWLIDWVIIKKRFTHIYLKSLLQNYFFRNPRIKGNFFRKFFILFDLGVFLVSFERVLYAWEILRCLLSARVTHAVIGKKTVVSHLKEL